MKMGGENFYHDEPLFGLDIGHSSVKAMQMQHRPGEAPKVLGYGMGHFAPTVKMNGVITNYESLAKNLYDFFKEGLSGGVYSRRVACSLPTSHSYTRLMKLPVMDNSEVAEAIKLEAEQYIPMPTDSLYIDYETVVNNESGIELLMVATPRSIVDSYVQFLESIDLEPIALEPSMSATSRVFKLSSNKLSAEPSILIDFGAISIDLAVFDKTMLVNSTLAGGSELITKLIGQALQVKPDEAFEIKSKYGIGVSEKQQKVTAAIQPVLDDLVKEVRRILRYYTERVGQSQRQVTHIFTSGGGATMPGINQFLARELNLPAEILNPWDNLNFGHLKKPADIQRSAYITVMGEAILQPKEIYS